MKSPTLRGVLLLVLIGTLAAAGIYFAARRSAPPASFEQVLQRYGAGTQVARIHGVDVRYRDEGQGPALVLLHGSFGSLRMFDDMLPQLAPRYRVIRYDQPPSGLSGPVPPDFALTSEAFLAGLLDHLGISDAALLGTSSGGIIAYRFAAAYPERTRALILSNVPPSAPVDNAGAKKRLSLWLQASITACMRFARPWSQTCWRDFLESNFERRERVTDALVEEYFDLNRRTGAAQFTSMTAIMRRDDEVLKLLAAVRAPTLLIWGTLDPVLPLATAELLSRRLTGTRAGTVLLDDVSHYPPLEAPDEVAAATLAFLAEQNSSTSTAR
jgi:pimeloyl-ACP methyl ester carboxylesterase